MGVKCAGITLQYNSRSVPRVHICSGQRRYTLGDGPESMGRGGDVGGFPTSPFAGAILMYDVMCCISVGYLECVVMVWVTLQ